jgi:oxygen-independent coproporphyrinogen-3 oxidase
MQHIESLYIHWPFCTSKCYYCDFVALEQHADFQDAYHETLLQEITAYGASLGVKPSIKTIFIGGGTPSLYPPEKLHELFALLHKTFDLRQTTEITLEANPADITEDRADAWECAGINRISCGVQVLDDAVLQRLNRRQRSIDVFNAAKILPKYFSNVSMDLIIGMPGVTDATWLQTIETLCACTIQHLSIYFLTVHEKTPLYFKLQRGDLILPDEDALLNLYEATVAYVASKGFVQYEISNFAQQGFASQHNIGYWQRRPYKGFGIGAASFDGTQRTVNDKNLTRYLDNRKTGSFVPLEIETLTPQQITLERLMLSLRQASGMPLEDMLECVEEKQRNSLIASLQELELIGLLLIENKKVRLTLRGMILENEVVLRLI